MRALSYIFVLLLSLSPAAYAEETDWTKLVHAELPFLVQGSEFWNAYPGSNPGHGEPHHLIGKLPAGTRVEVKTPADLASFVAEIRTPAEALLYVRFLSDPPARLDHPLPSFVPFREIREDGFAAFSAAELKRCGLSEPTVKESTTESGLRQFMIERWVVSFDQFAKQRRNRDIVTYPEVTRIRETLDAKGGYQVQSEVVPVQDLSGTQPIQVLD